MAHLIKYRILKIHCSKRPLAGKTPNIRPSKVVKRLNHTPVQFSTSEAAAELDTAISKSFFGNY